MTTEMFGDDTDSAGELGFGEQGSSNVYVTAYGPEQVDTEAISGLLAESDLGGVVRSHAYGSNFVTLVIEVGTAADDVAYDTVIGKVGVALGPHWSVKANVDASND